MIIVRVNKANAGTAESIMNNSSGWHLTRHAVPTEAANAEDTKTEHMPG